MLSRLWWSWLVFFATLTCTCVSVAAEGNTALVWVRNSTDELIVERVRGQISDLDVQLEIRKTEVKWPKIPSKTNAFAVVWFSRSDETVDLVAVHVSSTQSAQRRVLVREVGGGTAAVGGQLSSVSLESAALVIRAALNELLLTEPEPEPEPERDRAPTTNQLNLRAKHGALFVEAGGLVAIDAGERGTWGPSLRVGGSWKSANFSAFGTTSLPVSLSDEFGAMRLRRHSGGFRFGIAPEILPGIILDSGVAAGVVSYERRVNTVESVVQDVEERTTFSPLLGGDLRFGWRPGQGRVELGVLAGLYWAPAAPSIGYSIDGRFEPSIEMRTVQSVFGLTVKAQTDKLW